MEIFWYLGIVIFLARVFGDFISRLGYPSVIGEIFVGLMLGPSLFNIVHPNEIIKVLAEIGIILLIFQVGMEADLKKLAKVGIKAFLVAFLGIFLPLLLSFLICYFLLKMNFILSLFIGGTLAATSIGISVRVLKDLNVMKETFSQIVLAAAVVDDILGVFILVILSQLSGQADNILMGVGKLAFYLIVFFLFAPFLSQVMMKIVEVFSKKLESLDFIPSAVLSVILIFSFISHKFGSPEILGAFIVGLSLSSGFGGIKFLATEKQTIQKIEHSLIPLVWLLSPIFFVFIGLQVNLKNINFLSVDFWIWTIVIGIIALVSKVAVGFFVKGTLREKLMIGFSMLPRGEVGLIFAEIGRQNKIYDEQLYFIIVFVVLLTTFISPLALRNVNKIFSKTN